MLTIIQRPLLQILPIKLSHIFHNARLTAWNQIQFRSLALNKRTCCTLSYLRLARLIKVDTTLIFFIHNGVLRGTHLLEHFASCNTSDSKGHMFHKLFTLRNIALILYNWRSINVITALRLRSHQTTVNHSFMFHYADSVDSIIVITDGKVTSHFIILKLLDRLRRLVQKFAATLII